MGEITLTLTIFYFAGLVVFFAFYWEKLKDWKISLLFASMTLFVAREYYEIPVFFQGYLGLGHNFPMVFHHLLVILVFVVLVSYSKIKFTKARIILLVGTPFMLSPLLLLTPNPFTLYIARIVGLSVFGGVFTNGCSLVR